ncbi:hypothetical protein SAMN05421734_101294 [Pelagirhabdus alkalitolerans]|uniref:Uncharacterized protein n=1 Tax=Pelagirhabdus alkalitolerans TaxID=1612202 RepID=A0A1G6GMS1_9BACI|nr:hypothetical protein [Pelagirhabdus alkalitolerans]SDB83277.1 hypothetical protein SAMN05421734_101294 [Pelagirhabdus alkalitolerans]
MRLTSFLLLSVFSVTLFTLTLAQMVLSNEPPILISLFAFLFGTMLIALSNEYEDIRIKGPPKGQNGVHFVNMTFAVIIGASVTYLLHNALPLNAVIAAAFVGMVSAVFFKKQATPLYCGAFVGMSCSTFLPTLFCIFIAGIVSACLYQSSRTFLNGYGGKLGAIALVGTFVSSIAMGHPLQQAPLNDWNQGIILIIYAIVASTLTFRLHNYCSVSPVFASSFVSFAGTLLILLFNPSNNDLILLVMMAGTFAGMTSLNRLPSTKYLVLTGLAVGILFMFSQPYFDLAGGKLGLIAFMAVLSTRGMIDLLQSIRSRMPTRSQVKHLLSS